MATAVLVRRYSYWTGEGRQHLEAIAARAREGQPVALLIQEVADAHGISGGAVRAALYRQLASFQLPPLQVKRSRIDMTVPAEGEPDIPPPLARVNRAARRPADLSVVPPLVRDWLTGYYVRGKSNATVLNYRDDVRLFLRFLEARGVDLFAVTPDLIASYHRTLWRNGLIASTRRRYLVVLRQLFGYLVKTGYMAANPAALVDLPRVRKRPPQFFSDEEVQQLRRAIPDTTAGRRDRALIELGLSSLRRQEILGLDLEDLLLDRQQVKVTGKGGDTILQVVTEAAVRALRAWLDVRPLVDSQAVFVGMLGAGGRRRPDGRMEPSTALKLFKRYCRLAGIRSLRFHDLRHTAGTKLGDADVPLAVIQQVLRHTNPATSNIYVHIAGSKLREAMEKLAFPE